MKKLLHKIATSKLFDLLGVLIIFVVAYKSGYLFENLDQVTHWGGISQYVPFGIISALISSMSVMSTRLLARFSNLGNWIGIPEIILAAIIDYMLGNKGAIFTYPITFILQAWAINNWNKKDLKIKKIINGKFQYLYFIGLTILSFIFSFFINYLAFGTINTSNQIMFGLTVLVFGLSLTANFMNALKMRTQWKFWLAYDLVQLFKAFSQFNFANVGKYIYYIVMAIAGNTFWKNK